jgi:hypothetical protein
MDEEMICYIFGFICGCSLALFFPTTFKKLSEKLLSLIKADKCDHNHKE